MTDRFRVLQIVWLASMGGVVTVAVVAYVLLTAMDLEMAGLPPMVLRVAGPVAVVTMGAGLLMRRKLLEAIPAGARGEERLSKYQAAVISALAVIEGAGLVIIVLSLVANEPSWIPWGAAITLVLMVLARPRREELGTSG